MPTPYQSELTLFLQAEGYASGITPLFVQVDDSAPLSGLMPLFVESRTPTIVNSALLFVKNSVEGLSGLAPLFIRGPGDRPGAIPYSGGMPLWLERPTMNVAPLYLHAPGYPASGDASLYIGGAISFSGLVPLSIPSTFDVITDGLRLYTHGF